MDLGARQGTLPAKMATLAQIASLFRRAPPFHKQICVANLLA